MKFDKFAGYRIAGLPSGVLAGYFCGVLSVFILLVVFTAATGHQIRLKYEVMTFLGDSALLMAPIFLIPRRWRWTGIIPVVLLALYLTGSEIYYRYWGDYLPFTSIFTGANWNGFVAGSIPEMFNMRDAVILVIPGIYGIFLCLTRETGENGEGEWKPRILAFAGAIGFWALTFAGSLIQHRGYLRSIGADSSLEAVVSSRFRSASSLYGNWQGGLAVYSILEMKNLLERGRRHELTLEEREFIVNLLEKRAGGSVTFTPPMNRDKNLIFIVVESLNSDIVGKQYGAEKVTPTLDSLLVLPGTVAALNVYAQIGGGGSSDGQMIYNTGLLPIYNGCTAQLYGASSTFPSLAKSLGKNTAEEYIVEEGRVWFHTATSKSYGYDRLNDAAELEKLGIDPAQIGGDRAVFSMALQKLPELKQPFLAEIVTLSMHFPYNDPGVPRQEWIEAIEGIEESERNYLRMTNYFDRELRRFLDGLKAGGLYDNSVIVIASDHDQLYKNVAEIASTKNVSPIVFMALNAGITARIDRPAWQMDVYPTVLDIMGYEGKGYRGLGRSLLRELSEDGITEEDCRRASDLIIRSDFFGLDGGF